MDGKHYSHHPKLPAGFGSVRYLGPGRRKPYAVFPTTKGTKARVRAICYVMNWTTGVAVLAAWHAGQYDPGLPDRIEAGASFGGLNPEADALRDAFCQQMLSYFRAFIPNGCFPCTLQEGFEQFYAWKYSASAPKQLSDSAAYHDRWAFQRFSELAGRQMDSITVDELQQVVNRIELKRSAVDRSVTLIKGIYRHAISRELCSRNPAQYVRTPATPDSVSHQEFTDEELRTLWTHRKDPMVRMVLIMCYSGFRWSAYMNMETNLEEEYFKGGVKTEAGRNRIVPIHSAILPLVEEMLREGKGYHCGFGQYKFIREMKKKMAEIGIDHDERHHTPHSCRHTFSRLCESYGMREADRKRMMGHSFGNDITNGIYGHRTLEELRQEKIRV